MNELDKLTDHEFISFPIKFQRSFLYVEDWMFTYLSEYSISKEDDKRIYKQWNLFVDSLRDILVLIENKE